MPPKKKKKEESDSLKDSFEVKETKIMPPKKLSEPMLTFDRWFPTTGRPLHHKRGMAAYVNTKGRRTKAVWDALFKKY